MDIKKYSELKDKNLVSIKMSGNEKDKIYVFTIKHFSRETGEETEPEIKKIRLNVLRDLKKDLQEQINTIDVMISDCQRIG